MTQQFNFPPPVYSPNQSSFVEKVYSALKKEFLLFTVSFVVLMGSAVMVIRSLPNQYAAEGKILIEIPDSTEKLAAGNNDARVSDVEAVGDRVSPINNQVNLIQAWPLFEKALTQNKISLEQAPYSGLYVNSVTGTDLISVGYISESSDLAASVVNAIISVYRTDNEQANREKGQNASRFLEKKLPELQKALQKAQDKLQSFQELNQFWGTQEEINSSTRLASNLQEQIWQAQSGLSFTKQKIDQLRSLFKFDLSKTVKLAGLSQETNYQTLKAQLLQADLQVADLESRFADENPELINATQKRDKLRNLMRQYTGISVNKDNASVPQLDPLQQRLAEQWVGLELEYSAQSARLQQLSASRQQMQRRADQFPLLFKTHNRLQLEVDTARSNFLDYRQNLMKSQLVEQQALGNVRVIEPAIAPTNPVKPNRKLLFALSLVISLGISSLLVWLRTYNLVRKRTELNSEKFEMNGSAVAVHGKTIEINKYEDPSELTEITDIRHKALDEKN